MGQEILTREVCELLAQQLVNEQATLVKQEAIVESLIETLKEKKKSMIEKMLDGRFFKFDDSKVLAIAVEFFDWKDGMWVRACFAKTPESFPDDMTNLTKKEKSLLNQYQKLFKHCRRGFNDEACKEIQGVARELSQLKHRLFLVEWRSWSFSIEEFSSSTFFRNSGLHVGGVSRYGDSYLIEHLNCKY